MFVEIFPLTETVNVTEMLWVLISLLLGVYPTTLNLLHEIKIRNIVLTERPFDLDARASVMENVRRQNYRFTKQIILLGLGLFLCTQPQPTMQTIAGFALQMVSIYFVLVIAIDSVLDRRYLERWSRHGQRSPNPTV